MIKALLILLTLINSQMLISSREDVFTQFQLDYRSALQIPAQKSPSTVMSFHSEEIQTGSDLALADRDLKKEWVEEVVLDQLVMHISSPEHQCFDFLEDLTIYIQAEDLGEIEVAYLEKVPAKASNSLELIIDGNELKEYFKKSAFSLRAKANTLEHPTQDIQLEVHSRFLVTARVLP